MINPGQAEKSRQALNLFVDQLTERYQVDTAKIYIGGFSQGGIMSYSTGLTYPQKFKGIFVLSSRLLPEVKPLIRPASELQELRVFIAHGTADQTLPLLYAQEAKTYLQGLTPHLVYHEYPMGHTTSQQELDDLNEWLLQ